jgi:N-methylhydantoinase A/oxoprolinase/acetone carboxylase beta subunit
MRWIMMRPPSASNASFGHWRQTPVYQLVDLAAGQSTVGLAVVESETTTVVIGESDVAIIDERGWLDI